MINKIIKGSLNNRLLVLFAGIILIIAGAVSSWNIEVDVFPDLSAPTVVIMTEAPGMAAEEVERLVTFPLEASVNGATDVRRLRSSSTSGFSVVWVEFNWGTDIYRARQIVNEKISSISSKLPEGVGTPTLGPQSSLLAEALIIGLTSDTTDMMALRTLADWTLRTRLLSIGGVAQVTVIGGEIEEYQILVNPQKMRLFNVSLNEIMSAVEKMNVNASGGSIYQYGNEFIIRALLRTSNTADLSQAVIKTIEGLPVKIGDVADVRIGAKFPKLGLASEKGKPAVLLTITKQPNINTIELTKKLIQEVNLIKKELPKDVKVSTDIFRQSTFIESAISNIEKALFEGSIFLIIILFIFLNNWRSAFISMLAVPLSLFGTILVLNWLGYTLNTMSLGGMAIAVGSMVDDAIIDVENVYRRLKEHFRKPPEERHNIIEVVYSGSTEIRSSIFNATLIIIVTFIPLFFLSGMEGRLLKPLGISFIVSLFSSMLVAITLTPVLCSLMLNSEKKLGKLEQDTFLLKFLKKLYSYSLNKVIIKRKIALISAVILFLISIALLFTLGRSFLPTFNEGAMTLSLGTKPGISLEESNKLFLIAENAIKEVPEVITVARKTGRAELDEHAIGVNSSEIEAPYKLTNRSREEVFNDVRKKLSIISGINFEVGQPISHRIDHMLSGTRANIAIKIFGNDLNQMFDVANNIKNEIIDVEGLTDLNVEQQIERPQLQIKPKRDILARFGITMPEFARFIDVALSGRVVSEVYEGQKTFNIRIKYDETNRATIDDIRNIPVDTKFGLNSTPIPHENTSSGSGKIPLSLIADVVSASGPNTINRENMQRKIVVSANVEGRDLSGVVNDIKKNIENKIKLPEGFRIDYGGQFESEQEASRILSWVSIASILIVFLLLFQEFRKVKIAGIIMLNLPLALIGGVLTVFLTVGIISIPVIIGFIALFGIAARNGILLVSHYEDLKSSSEPDLKKRVIQGSLDRLNPILMTALCSALGMLPLALGSDLPGNEIQSPMAKVILGGLLTATALNLFFIPVVYFILNKNKRSEHV
ncbi:MAG: multidrug transporter AcrB [Ignavibacteria bacterium GWB2_35_12]|nr:MAG: multidrug transporter AcrB [Ignavibacteria bacterium GWA2_35_8]OGU38060.1 MAG: multidrug transporter AcrB [Ignavibacteria bacterium GWB2_35_12]OGU95181.1 MAG: multidrug transporter AcrB [Ignavibacteria bacterium RIFOXYA2_FULL_35_10]OGV25018.1 MAG: multidrug transporter AcrB [Ignavibacteria bacterium RIFOXYC2_FULL_35_21]